MRNKSEVTVGSIITGFLFGILSILGGYALFKESEREKEKLEDELTRTRLYCSDKGDVIWAMHLQLLDKDKEIVRLKRQVAILGGCVRDAHKTNIKAHSDTPTEEDMSSEAD